MTPGRECVLRDGPFQGDTAEVDLPLPEHIRVWMCGSCNDTHWGDEEEDWPPRAARYTLLTSEEEPALYVHDGTGVPGDQGEYPEQETPTEERELVPVGPGEVAPTLPWGPEGIFRYGPGTVYVNGEPLGTVVSIEIGGEL